MKIAVTGANGHVGSNLCHLLVEEGHQVRALIHHHDYALQAIDVEKVKGDLLDVDAVNRFVRDCDVVFHLAAYISIRGSRKQKILKINIEGTRNVIDATRENGVSKLIHFSSIHAFQQTGREGRITEDSPLAGKGAYSYDYSKAEGERMALAANTDTFQTTVISPTAIVGPTDHGPSLTGQALLRLYKRQIPFLVDGGYDWVDVRDVVRGALRAIDHGKPGEKYILSGTYLTLPEISALIGEVTGRKTIQRMCPSWLAHLGVPFIGMYSLLTCSEPLYTSESLQILNNGSRHISYAKATRDLGYQPRPIRETIADFFHWYLQYQTK